MFRLPYAQASQDQNYGNGSQVHWVSSTLGQKLTLGQKYTGSEAYTGSEVHWKIKIMGRRKTGVKHIAAYSLGAAIGDQIANEMAQIVKQFAYTIAQL